MGLSPSGPYDGVVRYHEEGRGQTPSVDQTTEVLDKAPLTTSRTRLEEPEVPESPSKFPTCYLQYEPSPDLCVEQVLVYPNH